ncbi:hypothetical protein [Saltatorellus ferox]|uniref:hypothetical protein n=1 Tax=Saltatorellus ferox TaxID=2528018 RepID=UPI003AF3FF74
MRELAAELEVTGVAPGGGDVGASLLLAVTTVEGVVLLESNSVDSHGVMRRPALPPGAFKVTLGEAWGSSNGMCR